MVALRWLAVSLCVVASAGCLEPNVEPTADQPQESQAAPSIALSKDEEEDRLVVVAVEAGFHWSSLGLMADPEGARATAGGADGAPPIDLVPRQPRAPSTSAEDVVAGDWLDFCAATAPAESVTVSVVHTQTNTLVYVTTFQSVAACG